jgi:thiol:disulfide interchange protein
MEIFKGFVSFLMGTIGAWMMWRGKKTMQPKMILWGGVLIVLSYWLFSIGGNDEASKETIKSIISTTTGQPPQP